MRPPLVLLLLLSVASMAPALALQRKGDRRPPEPGKTVLSSGAVRVAPGGEVTVADRPLGRLPMPPLPSRLEVREVQVGPRRLLHVRVSGPGGRAGELVLTAPPELRVLFRDSTGPQGVDGEWSRHVRLDSKGLLVFQRREGLVRCDREPIYLFPELYDFDSGRFRPVAAVVPRAGLPELQARRQQPGVPAGEPLNTFHLTGASTQSGDGQKATNLSAPVAAEDGRPDTGWAESLGGFGQGEFLTAQAQPSPYRLKALRIVPGDAASPRRFREGNRLKAAVLHLSPARGYRILFPRDPAAEPGRPEEPYWVVLPEPVETTCATLVLDEVYRGSAARAGEGGRTTIAELRFFTELEFGGGLTQLERDLDSPAARRGEAAVAVLIRLKEEGARVAAGSLDRAAGEGLSRRVRVLAASGLPEAAAPLVRALPRVEGAARTQAIDALVRLGEAAVAPLTGLLGSRRSAVGARGETAARAAAARVLGRLGGERARQALLQAAGAGPDGQRAGVVDGLGALAGASDLAAVLEAARQDGAPARRADLIHALGRLGRGDPVATARELASFWDRPGATFEERYRVLTSIGRLAPQSQLELLERASRDPDPVLRFTALEQARRVRGPAPLPLLRRALEDSYPPARTSAALALIGRPRDELSSRALAARLRREPWPMVGLAVAEAIAWHCSAQGVAALRVALSASPQGVDSRALHSLARCNPPGLADELLDLARDSRRPTALRSQALGLLTPSQASSRLGKLVELFDELRRAAARSDAAEGVAVWAAAALGRAGGSAAVEALADALALDPHEPIRSAAALGLGKLCARSGRPALERARQDSGRLVQRAAEEAIKRCRGRWK